MKAFIRISEAEWTVMNLVWKRSPLAASEIVDELAARHRWQPRTIRTLVARLVRKRALRLQEDGKRYLYSPLVTKDDCARQESRRLLDRVFGGEPAAMLISLVRNAELSREQICELKRILDDKEG